MKFGSPLNLACWLVLALTHIWWSLATPAGTWEHAGNSAMSAFAFWAFFFNLEARYGSRD